MTCFGDIVAAKTLFHGENWVAQAISTSSLDCFKVEAPTYSLESFPSPEVLMDDHGSWWGVKGKSPGLT